MASALCTITFRLIDTRLAIADLTQLLRVGRRKAIYHQTSPTLTPSPEVRRSSASCRQTSLI
ncbi:hypothetical protein [Brasilonema bromeliae]|uniref:hypothetical protein n=1 Tax=Brasilonema bromeliae TaxID=383615 RepID=UPI00145D80E8|nr:hypothetical protein [Brasilonema bromeliae]